MLKDSFMLLVRLIKYHTQYSRQDYQENGRYFFAFPFVVAQRGGDYHKEDQNSPPFKDRSCKSGIYAEKQVKEHICAGGENKGYDGGANAAKTCADGAVLHKPCEKRRYQKNDKEGRGDYSERSKKRAEKSALRRADEGCHINRYRPRGGFRNRNKVQKLLLGEPAVCKAIVAYHRYHSIAAAKGDKAYFKKGQKKTKIDHFLFPLPFHYILNRIDQNADTAEDYYVEN